jgi:cell division protein FtsZ
MTGQLEEERKVLKLEEPVNVLRNEVVEAPKMDAAPLVSNNTSTQRDMDEDVLIQGADRPELNFTLSTVSEATTTEKEEENEQVRRSMERMENLKRLSIKLKTPSPVSDLESVPAFRRRNVHLQQVDLSSESNVSRYTLSENPEDKKLEIRPNNSFLHDNVD